MKNIQKLLEQKAYNMRVASLCMTTQAGSGHPTSALSAADLVSAVFFYAMRFDVHNSENPHNDRFILSKGHASPILYAAYKEAGVLTDEQLLTYRQIDSVLEGHPTRRFMYTQAATGSLGMGLSIGAGMALAARFDKRDYYTYVVMGDSETSEGSVWEAAELAAHYKLNNLIALIDANKLGQTTETLDGYHLEKYVAKFTAFGWHTLVIDGHDMPQVMAALDTAKTLTAKPVVIIAKTIKGYGIEAAEGKLGFHGKAFSKEELPGLLAHMQEKFKAVVSLPQLEWHPNPPNDAHIPVSTKITLPTPTYTRGAQLATRKAYGQALAALGDASADVISLDAEVKNSTFADIFESRHPERFIQCFIAEQNMVSMAVGVERCGKMPFVSTFGAFFSRAYDQIRMAAIGQANLRLSGSHVGVSIGQDGPSQMALEDIALMCALPNSVVLYPCDAVSTWKLMQEMANYTGGISYVRTTRMETPIIYNNDEIFSIGGCKVLRQGAHDVVCIIAAGVTVTESLHAYEQLQKEGISVSVIDLYSVKPIDQETIVRVARASGNRIITVEDHYLQGGLGQAVAYQVRNTGITIDCLAVTQLPRSGNPQELLALMGIDAAAIMRRVKKYG